MPYHTTGIKAIQSAQKGWKKIYKVNAMAFSKTDENI